MSYSNITSRFELSNNEDLEPIVDVKISFGPYPCLLEESGEDSNRKRGISQIFEQPPNCREKSFVTDLKHALFEEVDGFLISEYDLLERNGIFTRLELDNPYYHSVEKTIFNKNDHKKEYYRLYFQRYLKYS